MGTEAPALRAFARRRPARMLLAAVLALLVSCGGTEQPLRLAFHPWPGYALYWLGGDPGAPPPSSVQLYGTDTASESIALLAAGQVDAAMLTLDETLRARAAGVLLGVVALIDVSHGADALLVAPGIDSLAALRGRRVGLEAGSTGAVLLEAALAAGGLSTADVAVVSIVGNHREAWAGGALDAIVTYEPSATALEREGLRRLFDSSSIPRRIVDVLAVRLDALQSREAGVRQAVATLQRGRDGWMRNPADAKFQLAGHLGLSAEEVETSLRRLQLPDVAANRHLLSPPAEEMTLACEELREHLRRAEGVLAPECNGMFRADFLPRQR